MLVALVFRQLRNFGPSGRIGPVFTYQLTKKLKIWLTKGNAPIKLLVYIIFIILHGYNLVCTYPNSDQVYWGSLDSINFYIPSGSLNWSRLWQNKRNYIFPKRCTEDLTLSIMLQNLKYPNWWWKGGFTLKTWVLFACVVKTWVPRIQLKQYPRFPRPRQTIPKFSRWTHLFTTN